MKLFSAKEIKIAVLSILITGLIAVLITILVMMPKNSPVEKKGVKGVPDGKGISLSDFMVPSEYKELAPQPPHYFDTLKEKWEEERIKKFWIDPRDISLEILIEKNNRLIDSLLQEKR